MTPDDRVATPGPLVRSNVSQALINGFGARSAVRAG